MSSSAASLIRDTRLRHGLSQQSLARRAGTSQRQISRIERGETSPSVATVQRLLAVMGEDLVLATCATPHRYDPSAIRDELRRPMSERMGRSLRWNRFAGGLTGAAARERSKR